MTKNMALATIDGSSGAIAPLVNWQTALDTFLDTLSSPRTQKAYKRAVTEAMRATDVQSVADLMPPMLAAYRAGPVARLDIDRENKLSPATVNLKLGALRSFLHFCRLTGVTLLGKDLIAFVLKSPKAEVRRPYEVLSEAERQRGLTRVYRLILSYEPKEKPATQDEIAKASLPTNTVQPADG